MSRITAAAAHFLGYSYAFSTAENVFPRVEAPLPNLPARSGGGGKIDCSTFITAILVYAHPEIDWDAEAYADLQIFDATRPWSPVDAWERHGLGKRISGPVAGWGVYQSWVSVDPLRAGHQWAYHGRQALRLHSTSKGGRGPTMDRGVEWGDLKSYYKAGITGVELIR